MAPISIQAHPKVFDPEFCAFLQEEMKTRADIEDKKKQLRLLVGNSYRYPASFHSHSYSHQRSV